MDLDGVDAAVFFPNLALFVLFTDDHELSMAHARVWNDWIAETYLQHKDRMRPTAAIPLTNIPDAVAEIERAVKLGLRALLLPEIPPVPYWSREYEPVWNGAEAHGLPIFIHVATGGVKVKEDTSRHRVHRQGPDDRDEHGQGPADRRHGRGPHHGRRQHRRREPVEDHGRPDRRRRL